MVEWDKIREKALGNQADFSLPDDVKLPMMRSVVTKFTQKANDPNFPSKKLGEIIESDTGLTCDLLRHVNSAAFGLRKQVSTPGQAITLLGLKKTKLLLLTSAVKGMLDSQQSKLINIKNFWIANLEKAIFAREIAKLLKADADVAFSTSLLQDFLLPILTDKLLQNYMGFGTNQGENAQDLTAYERKQFGWDHATAGANVLHNWGFPDELVCSLYFHHRGSEILEDPSLGQSCVAAVAISSLVPDAIRQIPNGMEDLIQLQEKLPYFDLHSLAEIVQNQFAEMAPTAQSHITLLQRVEKAMAQAS